MGYAGVRSEIAAQRTQHQMLIGSQKAPGEDTRAVRADVDGLAHVKIVAFAEVEANEHALLHTLFGTLTRGRAVHKISLPIYFGDVRPGGLTGPS